MGLPMVKNALEPDDSAVTLTYIDRADVTIPVIASNKGRRPGVIEPVAGLRITVRLPSDGKIRDHIFLATAINGTRENLLVPENTSKQFFFAVRNVQPLPGDVFKKLADDIESYTLNAITRCTVLVSYLDFSGKMRKSELVLFDASGAKIQEAKKGDERTFSRILGAAECIGKIPQDVRRANKLD
jgi:hypothetical protein